MILECIRVTLRKFPTCYDIFVKIFLAIHLRYSFPELTSAISKK